MRFVRFARRASTAWGLETDSQIYLLSALPAGAPTFQDITTPAYRSVLQRALEREALPGIPSSEVSYLAPVPSPGKIVCAGLNYHDHAEEQDEEIPTEPLLFAKSPSAVTNPDTPIVHPKGVDQVDFEVELGIVMGRTASRVAASEYEDYVAGYTIVNDVSARDAQFSDGQFFRGKSYDTFAPMGPALVTGPDFNPNAVDVSLRVNGEAKQESNTREFIFDIGELIEYISHVTTLQPGDVISTGTPGGVGIFQDPPELLAPGDEVVAEIEGIGTLRNTVVGET